MMVSAYPSGPDVIVSFGLTLMQVALVFKLETLSMRYAMGRTGVKG